MSQKILYLDTLELLYRETLAEGKEGYSTNLAESVLKIKVAKKRTLLNILAEKQDTENVKALLTKLTKEIDNHPVLPEDLEKAILLSIEDNDNTKEIMSNIIDKAKSTDKQSLHIKKLRDRINNEVTLVSVQNYFNDTMKGIKSGNSTLDAFMSGYADIQQKIDGLIADGGYGDPAILDVISINNIEDIKREAEQIKKESLGTGRFVTGFQAVNDSCGGGPRRGETVIVTALENNYKTTFSLTLFAQILQLNKPKDVLTEEELLSGKKPMFLWFSFEDKISDKFLTLYKYLYFDKHGVAPDIGNVSQDEIAEYIHRELTKTGFEVRFLRVDPTEWSHIKLSMAIQKELGRDYVLIGLFLDYLSHLPKTGIDRSGPMGTDMRALLRKMKNKAMRDNFLFLTPHQMNVKVNDMLEDGVYEKKNILNAIWDRGMFEGTKQLGQELDLVFFLMKFIHNDEAWLHVRRGKSRAPEIISEDKLSFYYKFPHKTPIPSDLGKEISSFKKLPDANEFIY